MLQALSRWKAAILAVSAVLMLGLFLSRHIVGPFSGGRATVGPMPVREAAEHVGQRAEVCGTVAEVRPVRSIDGNPTFINVGGKHPNQALTALIWGNDRSRWAPAPAAQYADREICVTGTIERHKGTPQIIVSSPGHIQVQ